MSTVIKNWKDLAGLENDDYRIEVDLDVGCGWLRSKNPDKSDYYLTTHTFYGKSYKGYMKLLQSCGFDVELISWDKESD